MLIIVGSLYHDEVCDASLGSKHKLAPITRASITICSHLQDVRVRQLFALQWRFVLKKAVLSHRYTIIQPPRQGLQARILCFCIPKAYTSVLAVMWREKIFSRHRDLENTLSCLLEAQCKLIQHILGIYSKGCTGHIWDAIQDLLQLSCIR